MTINSSIKLGLIVFANDGGLGAQTRRLYQMLQPDKVLVVDSSGFSQNKEIHLDWYEGADVMVTHGFPRNYEVLEFIKGLTHVLTCENPYNFYLVHACRERRIKTICQTNYEFCENLQFPHLPVPDLFLMPSHWMINEMKAKFGDKRVIYLPPPIDTFEFMGPRTLNLARKSPKRRLLHIIGTLAWKDRNGTLDLLEALRYSAADFELVIKSQRDLPEEYCVTDERVSYSIGNAQTNSEMYEDFDALLLPRRFGGLSLTTNEALMSGLPVMMLDISPNNQLLPKDWLLPAHKIDVFEARDAIDVYATQSVRFAEKIDDWCGYSAVTDLPDKNLAVDIGVKNFSFESLLPRYLDVFQSQSQ